MSNDGKSSHRKESTSLFSLIKGVRGKYYLYLFSPVAGLVFALLLTLAFSLRARQTYGIWIVFTILTWGIIALLSKDHQTKKTPKGWQKNVSPEHGEVPARHLRQCQEILREDPGTDLREDEIRYLNRYHGIVVLERIGVFVFAAFIGLVITMVTLIIRSSGFYGVKSVSTHKQVNLLPWFVPPLVGLLLVLVMVPVIYVLSYRWRYTYIMITNIGLRLLVLPPRSSYVITLDIDDSDLDRIESVDIKQSRTGKLLGFGGLDVTLVGNTIPKKLRNVKDPQMVKDILDTARLAYQRPIPSSKVHSFLKGVSGDATQEIPPSM